MGVNEVHLQRLVFDDAGFGMARAESILFEANPGARNRPPSPKPRRSAQTLGVTLDASGATEPGLSLKQQTDDEALGDLPAALVADVFHRPRTRLALLHRAVLRPRV